MATTPGDKLISVIEAARECRRNPETVRRWIWSGKLPAEKLGNQLFVRRSVLEAYCRGASMRHGTEAEAGFLRRAIALQDRMKARGVGQVDAGEQIHRVRDERMSRLDESVH